jgi:hypothetical protein
MVLLAMKIAILGGYGNTGLRLARILAASGRAVEMTVIPVAACIAQYADGPRRPGGGGVNPLRDRPGAAGGIIGPSAAGRRR